METNTVEQREPVSQQNCMLIHSTLSGKLNLADFQNAVPVVRELSVANETEINVKELKLTIASEPPFLKPKTWHIDHINAGQTLRINDLDLSLDGALLGRLTESDKAVVTFRLTLRQDDSDELAVKSSVVELLPRNQWGGLSSMPDMVAAFVQPNEPIIERTLKQAAEILKQAGRSGAIDGYQGGSRRVWEMASAIWSAIGALGLDYALPPASFESYGQKVRSPSQIADSGLGTCMDLALFVCAVLEQAGLNPLLVFTKGHAFPGVWLKSEEFSTSVIDDVTALRKRVKLTEMVLFETTLLTHRPLPAFSYAVGRGEELISEAEEQNFQLAVDIRRARLQRIKPLASEHAIERGELGVDSSNAQAVFEVAPDLPDDLDNQGYGDEQTSSEDRLTRWQRKLLDLSLRNNLLSFKTGKKSLKLDAPSPGLLEDILAEGHALKLLSRPDLMVGNDPRSQAIYEGREREDVRRQHALDALKRREVFVGLTQDEMDARLIELFRSSRTSLQEGGANTLYLALGFLSWTRDDKDGKKFKAPLVLIPVTLERRSARSGFSLKLHDDEPRFNPTLIEMLRQDFELEIAVQDTELPKDDSGLDIAGIWKTVSLAVKEIKNWEVVEEVVLATFSFAKYLMWKDLTERTEQLKQNAVVRHLIDTPRDSYESTVEFPDSRKLDVELSVKETFCPLPVDSSQLSAIVAGSKGKDFVLIGPPGTGKSQTISNLIAQCLAERKRVLFVSEKMAALDVVYRRLAEVGLGNFCLELHSNKARKTEVLEQLRTSWDATAEMDPDEWHTEAVRLESLRGQLNGYVERLHHRHGNDLTVYYAIGKVISGRELPLLHLSWPSSKSHNASAMNALREAAELLDVNAQVIGLEQLINNPLSYVVQTQWAPLWQESLLGRAREIGPAVQAYEAAAAEFVGAIGLPMLALEPRVRDGIRRLAETLPAAFGHDWQFVLRPDAKTIADGLRQSASLTARYREVHQSLSLPRSNQVLEDINLGISQLSRYLELQAELSPPWSEELRTRLALGIELLRARQHLIGQLTLPYRENIPSITVKQLQSEWLELQDSSWPMSLFRRISLTKKLRALAASGEKPDLRGDIERLVKIDSLQSEIESFEDLSLLTSNAWAGLKTELDVVRASLGFQGALERAQARQLWEDIGLDPVSRGQCGDVAREDLKRIREMRQIHQLIIRLGTLANETGGIWAGYETDLAIAKTYVNFQAALVASRTNQNWPDEGFANIELIHAEVAAELTKMRELVLLQQRLQDYSDLSTKTANLWSGLQTSLEKIEPALKFFEALSGALAVLAKTPEMLAVVKVPIALLLGDSNVLLEPSGSIAGAGRVYCDALHVFNKAVTNFSVTSGSSESDMTTIGGGLPSEIMQRAEDVLNASSRLHAWCAWRKARQEAIALGLSPLVNQLEQGAIQLGQVKETFEVDYCRWWLNAVVDTDDILRTFVSAEHEKRIRDFRELDKRFVGLTQAWVRAQLSAGRPSPERVSRGSEWGLLRYEMQKRSRHLPLRELMSKASNVVMTLTPCLLMSPLSVAQYLPQEIANFDVVVFDEASQIPVWDAIGAMARGKQVIMVGDPKQLPPTSFFDRAESDSDDVDVETELESILEECIGANLPTMKLSWHYRSKHESLIAFSNYRYYDGDLVTFPSPVTNDRAVNFNFVSNGQYERGGARTNKPEAKALVADLISKLKSPGFRDSKMTIGVVTFNTEQQSLIEDLLDDERRRDPSIEAHFLETQLEPVFVKNLESVQGDERDIMYFSITYGPGVDGTMPMNFGPMNQQGGERRLNVAITRARQELRVFGSFRPEQMDLSRTQALGVRDLKHYLEFAEKGARALGEIVSGSLGDFDSPFEQAVAIALHEKGWILHPQVGVSAFRIDLGVVDPDAPGRYLAGIECDGATYHRSATARDRDKLREQVLRGLGWEIIRIWSTDWWIDMEETLERIHLKLECLLEEARSARSKSVNDAEDALQPDHQTIAGTTDHRVQVSSALFANFVAADNVVSPTELAFSPFGQDAFMSPSPPVKQFVEVDFSLSEFAVNPEAFFEITYNPCLLEMIGQVVNVEGPVLDEVLARRIARLHGWVRTGAKIQERVVRLASQYYESETEDVGIFFWPKGRCTTNMEQFRHPADGTARLVNEISLAELRALAADMRLAGHDRESGVTAMARDIGLRKLSAISRARLERAWMSMSQQLGPNGGDLSS